MPLSNTQRTILAVLVTVSLVAFTVAAWAVAKWGFARSAKPETNGGITVIDSAQVRVQPDLALVTFGVVTKSKDARKAGADNAAKTSAVIAAIVKAGIPNSRIKTTDYSLNPETDWDKSPARIVGYSASNSVEVRTKDIAGIGSLIDAATKAGANNVNGISFDVEDKKALKQQALSLAVKKAKGKAQAIATALGSTLGPAVSASETVNDYVPVSYNTQWAAKGQVQATPVMPGETTISAQVKVVYSLR